MARPARFPPEEILDEAARLLADGGVDALSLAGVARSLGAPSGSIYHRFASRDVLVASLWLRAVERLQVAVAPSLHEPDPSVAVREAALSVLRWTRGQPTDARVLLLYRSSDLLRGDWPAELTERNLAQRRRIEHLIEELCRRLGAVAAEDRRRVAFAVVDLPYAAVRMPLARGETPAAGLDAIVRDAVDGVIGALARPRSQPS